MNKVRADTQIKKKFGFTKSAVMIVSILISALALLTLAIFVYFLNRFYPGTYLGDISLAGKTLPEAQTEVREKIALRENRILTFKYNDPTFSINPAPLSGLNSVDSKLEAAFKFGHTNFSLKPLHINPVDSGSPLKPQIDSVAKTVNQEAIDASLKVDGDQITVSPSQDGLVLDTDKLTQEVLDFINLGILPDQTLPMKKALPKITYNELLEIKKDLDKIKLSPIKLTFKTDSFDLDLPTILALIDLNNTQSVIASSNLLGGVVVNSVDLSGLEFRDVRLSLNREKLVSYLKTLSPQIDKDVEEPLFNFDKEANAGRGKVTEFRPPQIGYKLNLEKSAEIINQKLVAEDFSSIPLVVDETLPKNKLTNELGIKELIGEGVSHFAHSIPNRVYNVELAASRINGTLIPPGGVFSYNDSVGEVSAATGFKQGYVIKSGKTVLDDGGGVCQDSTTLFRAALHAGLPIIERTAHAYRVGYYEQDSGPGYDATVFAPSVDFKFKNDTGAYILVQATVVNDNTLYVDLYGTSDGRVATVSNSVITSTSPALPDVHQDDPTLPKGQIKQVDFSAPGASVYFTRTVTRAGQIIANETWRSNYRPWASVFLVGTGG